MREGRDRTELGSTLSELRTAAHTGETLPPAAGGLKKCVTDHCNNISLLTMQMPAPQSSSSRLGCVPAPFSLFPAMYGVDS